MPQVNGGSRTLRSAVMGNYHAAFWRPVREGDFHTEFNNQALWGSPFGRR